MGLKNNLWEGGEEDYGVGWFTGVPFCLSFVLRIDLWASDFELVLRSAVVAGKEYPYQALLLLLLCFESQLLTLCLCVCFCLFVCE